MVTAHDPAGLAEVKGAVGATVGDSRGEDLDIIEQALALAHEVAFEEAGGLNPVVEVAGAFDRGPRRFLRFIAVGPAMSQAMVAARVNQFQAAPTLIGPVAPVASRVN